MAENDMAKKIKSLRAQNHLTLEQVAQKVGVGKSTVRKWETGMIANMRRDKIAALAEALNTTPAYLMGWNENEYDEYYEDPISSDEDHLLNDILKRQTESRMIEGIRRNQTEVLALILTAKIGSSQEKCLASAGLIGAHLLAMNSAANEIKLAELAKVVAIFQRLNEKGICRMVEYGEMLVLREEYI